MCSSRASRASVAGWATSGTRTTPRTYRGSLSYTSAGRPIVSLDELSALECALIGATATTKAIIASKGNNLRALPHGDRAAAVETIRAFSAADLNVGSELSGQPGSLWHRLLLPAGKHQVRLRVLYRWTIHLL